MKEFEKSLKQLMDKHGVEGVVYGLNFSAGTQLKIGNIQKKIFISNNEFKS